jgi:cytochrome P450
VSTVTRWLNILYLTKCRNRRLHAQQRSIPFVSAMRDSLEWNYLGELKSSLVRWSPLLRLISWNNGRVMNKYLSNVLDERYTEWRAGRASTVTNKSAIDLMLSDYINKYKDKASNTLDPKFKRWAIPQLRLMFFVGHDSTSATICYTFYLMSQNPSALQKLRDEHDEVFGGTSEAPRLLREQPQLLSKLTYTTAVIKEVLRLFPPASGFRLGRPGVDLYGNGNRYPTENSRIWVLHSVLHRNPRYWKEPLSFIPERFLVGPEDPLYPVKGAWRPFEHGPRNCLGQTLAMLDLRISLVMTMRTFNVKPAYDEWDKLHGIPKLRTCTFQGERAYQIGHGGAHPADALPCRISVRE